MPRPTPSATRLSVRFGSSIARCRFGLAVAALAACGAAAAAGSTDVAITQFAFTPRELTVAPGTRVRWVNHDEVPHTVTSTQGQAKVLASRALDTDDGYELTFAEEGDYGYYCAVHPFMTGVVHVRKR